LRGAAWRQAISGSAPRQLQATITTGGRPGATFALRRQSLWTRPLWAPLQIPTVLPCPCFYSNHQRYTITLHMKNNPWISRLELWVNINNFR
jgi:hypothetical protein